MAEYSSFVALAQRLIAKRGRLVILEKMSAAASDPGKPWKGSTPSAQPLTLGSIRAVFLSTSDSSISTIIKDEDLLKRASDVALVAPQEQDLREFTGFIDGGKRMKIEWVQVLEPGDTVCLYVFGVTR